MKRIRTFVAIDIGKKIRKRLISLQEKFMEAGVKAKWVDPDNLHLTLLFLGEVEYNVVPDVCRAVAEAVEAISPFAMTVAGVGCFPTPRRPRVLWTGITEGGDAVKAMHDALEPPLLDLGCYRREERKYTPHLTIGRVAGDRRKQQADLSPQLDAHSEWVAGETQVGEIHVFSSELRPKGPIYTVLSRASLGG